MRGTTIKTSIGCLLILVLTCMTACVSSQEKTDRAAQALLDYFQNLSTRDYQKADQQYG